MPIPFDVDTVRSALADASVEVYRADGEDILIAERVRFHMMDSGVRLRLSGSVCFTARAQRSDFPNEDEQALFARVRTTIGADAKGRGYAEASAERVDVKDPVDETRVLDVWHEVTYEKHADALSSLIEEVRWALSVDKYVA